MVPILFMVLISMTRALWVAILFSCLIMIFFYGLKGKLSIRNIIKICFIMGLFIIIISLSINFLVSAQGREVEESMGTRVQTFEQLGADYSLMIRVVEIMQVLEKANKNPILGCGFGDHIMQRFLRFGLANYVDNAFIWILEFKYSISNKFFATLTP